jgi:hypothetical protein
MNIIIRYFALTSNNLSFLLNRTMISPFTSSYSNTTEKCVVYCADLHWGGFTTQWGEKKRINGADEKYTIWWISKCINWAEFRTHLHVPFFSHMGKECIIVEGFTFRKDSILKCGYIS